MPIEVIVPPLSATADTLILIDWLKKEGEKVAKDEPLFTVETDKATLEVESPATGVLRNVTAKAGDEVPTLRPIALIVAEGETFQDAPASKEAASSGAAAMPVAPIAAHAPVQPKGDRLFISPRAKRLAEERGIDWQAIAGTGPEGAIIERDVRTALQAQPRPKAISPTAQRMAEQAGVDWQRLEGSGAGGKVVREDISQALAAQAPPDNEALEILPFTGVRAVIASRMKQSAGTTAPVTLTSEIDATELVALRSRLIADGVSCSYNDILLAVLARALREHPRLNASLQGDAVHVWKRIHIGVAVDSEQGLRVPVVRDVDSKGVSEIGRELTARIASAREGKSSPEEMRGGTFTLTNLGMFGIDAFTPVINLPETAILGVGRIKPEPSVVGDQIAIRQKMWLSLTFDHRLIDGGPAARFLQRVAQLIEKPHLLLS